MNRYVALLRGINVGGANKVPMAALRQTCTSAGCTDVVTYIQSGNVVLSSPLPPAKLRTSLESAIAEQLEVSPIVVVRTDREIAEVVSTNPFPDADPAHLHVAFFAETPDKEHVAALAELDHPTEKVLVRGMQAYFCLPDGIGRATVPNLFGRKVKTPVTVRNWRTVNKLVELSSPEANTNGS